MFIVGSAANILPYILIAIFSFIFMAKGELVDFTWFDYTDDVTLTQDLPTLHVNTDDIHLDYFLQESYNYFFSGCFSLSYHYYYPQKKLKTVLSTHDSRGPPTC